MPTGQGNSHRDITFIIGNPRSKQNVSRIRRHASSKTIKDVEDHVGYPAQFPPKLASRASGYATSGRAGTSDGPIASSAGASVVSPNDRSQRRYSLDAVEFEVLPSNTITTGEPSSHDSSSLLTSSSEVNLPHLNSFGFTSRSSGALESWETERPHPRSSALYGSAPGLFAASAPELPALPSIRHVVRSAPHQPNTRVRSRGHPYLFSTQKWVSGVSESQRRIQAGPGRPLSLSAEDVGIERCLALATSFYLGQYESTWGPRLQQDGLTLDMTSDIEIWDESTHTAAALIEVGRTGIATKIVRQQMQSIESLLSLDHPELFSVLAIVALDTNYTPLGQLRRHLRNRLAPASETMLGASHPLSQLLKMELSAGVRAQVRIAMQKRIFDLIAQIFGENTYQTLCQFFILATNLEDQGHYEEALTVNTAYLELAAKLYGLNSLIVVFGLIEQSSIYLAAGQLDVRAELHIHDALRQLSIIDSHPAVALVTDNASSEREKRTNMVAHCKIAALRILSRLHWMRSNYEAAMHFRQEALDCGKSVLGPDAIPVLLAEEDLNMLEGKERWQASVDEPLGDQSREYHDLTTDDMMSEVGSIPITRRGHTTLNDKVTPSYRCAVYGFLQMPTFEGYKIPAPNITAGETLMVSQKSDSNAITAQ